MVNYVNFLILLTILSRLSHLSDVNPYPLKTCEILNEEAKVI